MGILMLIELALNIAGINVVAILNQVSVWWHIAIVAAIVVLVFLAGKPDVSGLTLFAIQPQDSPGSWNNNLGRGEPVSATGRRSVYPLVLAFFFSLLQANWTYTGYDASAHVAEETVGARVASAWGMFLSVAVSAVVGFIFLFALTTHLPNLSTLFPASSRPDPAAVQPVLLRRRRRRHRHPQVQPRRRARRHLLRPASRSRWRSAACRRSRRPAGCCSPSAATTGSPARAG